MSNHLPDETGLVNACKRLLAETSPEVSWDDLPEEVQEYKVNKMRKQVTYYLATVIPSESRISMSYEDSRSHVVMGEDRYPLTMDGEVIGYATFGDVLVSAHIEDQDAIQRLGVTSTSVSTESKSALDEARRKGMELILEYKGTPMDDLYEYPHRADDSDRYIANAYKLLDEILELFEGNE